ncbi:MAG: ABC transporter substrate-binding protein [Pigmentiphaga sp.]|uniref:ABC transporter substrate-binding protein n=1 Tax=Pigmentiphaga sp. TaxID=1977564 RepID=UPI0029B7B6E9|nr:ABC transporter substrate-binding protein [Pigmentiphaga sp.]MDX3905717.1 ABC transporter substrate-binding protein [Pigmentiphaga sp.]
MNLPLKALLAIAFGVILPAVAGAQTPVKLVLDWAFEGPQSMWTAAAESGCFTDKGIKLGIDRGMGSGDAISKVASGAYNIGVADFGSVVAYNAAHPGQKLTIVFIVSDASPLAVVATKKSGVAKPKDLEGKRLAGPQGESARVMFPAFAKINGVDAAKVEWVTVTPDLRQATVAQGKADGAAGHLNTILKGLRALKVSRDELVVLDYASHGVKVPGNTVIVKEEWARANKKAVQDFLSCTVKGIKMTIDDPKAAIATLKKYNSMVDSTIELDNLDFATNMIVVTPNVKQHGFSFVDATRYEAALSMVAESLSVAKPAVADIWSGDYLPPKSELAFESR